MTNLLIDIGNTSVKASFANDMKLEKVIKYEGDEVDQFILSLLKERRVEMILLSTVRESKKHSFEYLKDKCDKVIVVDGKFELPTILNRYKNPHNLGSDRLLSAIAVNYLFPNQNSIIFDFGTALTIDFITKNNEYNGGNISLGLESRFRALSDYTQRLPLVKRGDEKPPVGRDTSEAIANGVILGLIFEVNGYISEYPNYNYVFTGGDAIYFAERVKSSIFVVYNLVLIGLARIAHYYAKER